MAIGDVVVGDLIDPVNPTWTEAFEQILTSASGTQETRILNMFDKIPSTVVLIVNKEHDKAMTKIGLAKTASGIITQGDLDLLTSIITPGS